MPTVTCKADMSRFSAAIKKIIVEHGKDAATELNKRTIQVLIGAKGYQGAVHFTRKATEARIRKDLGKMYHVSGTVRGFKSGSNVKLIFILASKRITKNGGGKGLSFEAYRNMVAQVAEAIFQKRVQSRAFIAAGWLTCAHKLMAATPGISFTGKQSNEVKVYPDRRAARSYSIAAEPGRLTATCYNMAAHDAGSDAVAEEGLNKGINEQIRDMEGYLQKKLEASAQKVVRQLVGLR